MVIMVNSSYLGHSSTTTGIQCRGVRHRSAALHTPAGPGVSFGQLELEAATYPYRSRLLSGRPPGVEGGGQTVPAQGDHHEESRGLPAGDPAERHRGRGRRTGPPGVALPGASQVVAPLAEGAMRCRRWAVR